jgi:DNA helicase-2/ATP-dependent DNA helicase PcrA
MSEQQKILDLEDERYRERRYKEVLAERERSVSIADGPASGGWTGTGSPEKRVYGKTFVGRVSLVKPDDLFGAEFYIGETYAVVDGINVFSWATPIACTFYQGTDHHDLCPDVGALRVFRRDKSKGEIADFVDEKLRPDAPLDPFRSQISNPAIPSPATIPEIPALPDEPKPTSEQIPSSHGDDRGGIGEDLPQIRAASLLREQLLAPRGQTLAPVLSTLQPDQYELVTRSSDGSVIIEGHPGTGKTIIATHRAAYLIHEAPGRDRLTGNVLLVGPTPGYSRHVRGVIDRLAGVNDQIAALSLPELADLIIGSSEAPVGSVPRSYFDVGWEVARFARSAIAEFRMDAGRPPLPAEVFDVLRVRSDLIADDDAWADYLKHLPQYREAIKMRVHSPLIAFIHWELNKPETFTNVEHVIVDEAQDVTPLEWLLLNEINVGHKWTILGDLNQRRSDHSLPDWDQVLVHIAIDPRTPKRTMKRGYRSTKPILAFANRLLPKDQHEVEVFQQAGPEPRISAVRKEDVGDTVAQEVDRLLSEYPGGSVAVICQSSRPVTLALRQMDWSSDATMSEVWSRDDRRVRVLAPDAARGLEYDAVIVVEPSEFPKNFGRHGPLYTALTRANRELSIVHSGKLPAELSTGSVDFE